MTDALRAALLQLATRWQEDGQRRLNAETSNEAAAGAAWYDAGAELHDVVNKLLPEHPAGTLLCGREHHELDPTEVVYIGPVGPLCAHCLRMLTSGCKAVEPTDVGCGGE